MREEGGEEAAEGLLKSLDALMQGKGEDAVAGIFVAVVALLAGQPWLAAAQPLLARAFKRLNNGKGREALEKIILEVNDDEKLRSLRRAFRVEVDAAIIPLLEAIGRTKSMQVEEVRSEMDDSFARFAVLLGRTEDRLFADLSPRSRFLSRIGPGTLHANDGPSPFAAIDPRHGVARFQGREDHLRSLLAWAKSPQKGIAILKGGRGTGKSRLAIQACDLIRDHGILAGFPLTTDSWIDDWLAYRGDQLVVVDNVEWRGAELEAAVIGLSRAHSTAAKLLIVSRDPDKWWSESIRTNPNCDPDLVQRPFVVDLESDLLPEEALRAIAGDTRRYFNVAGGDSFVDHPSNWSTPLDAALAGINPLSPARSEAVNHLLDLETGHIQRRLGLLKTGEADKAAIQRVGLEVVALTLLVGSVDDRLPSYAEERLKSELGCDPGSALVREVLERTGLDPGRTSRLHWPDEMAISHLSRLCLASDALLLQGLSWCASEDQKCNVLRLIAGREDSERARELLEGLFRAQPELAKVGIRVLAGSTTERPALDGVLASWVRELPDLRQVVVLGRELPLCRPYSSPEFAYSFAQRIASEWPDEGARAVFVLLEARAAIQIGRLDVAEAKFEEGLQRLEKVVPSNEGELGAQYATGLFEYSNFLREYRTANAAVEKAVESVNFVRNLEVADRSAILHRALVALGRAHYQAGNSVDALRAYDEAISLSELPMDKAGVLTSRAMALTQLRRPNEALTSLESALKCLPQKGQSPEIDVNRTIILHNLAETHLALGNMKEALEDAKRADQHLDALLQRYPTANRRFEYARSKRVLAAARRLNGSPDPALSRLSVDLAAEIAAQRGDARSLTLLSSGLTEHLECLFACGLMGEVDATLARISENARSLVPLIGVLAIRGFVESASRIDRTVSGETEGGAHLRFVLGSAARLCREYGADSFEATVAACQHEARLAVLEDDEASELKLCELDKELQRIAETFRRPTTDALVHVVTLQIELHRKRGHQEPERAARTRLGQLNMARAVAAVNRFIEGPK